MSSRRFHRICGDLNVEPLRKQLEEHPELWDINKFRIGTEAFYQTSDIWVRYKPLEELHEPKDYLLPHLAAFYPAWSVLTELHPLIHALMYLVGGIHLGAILITRKAPGVIIPWHSDRGSWNAEFYDAKIFVTLKKGGCVFSCVEDNHEFQLGEAWTFNNLLPHTVSNLGDQEEITLIICIRSISGNYLRMKE